jgi:hypothetical protein
MRPIIGSEEIAAGRLTRGALRWNYTAVYPDVYLPKDANLTLRKRIEAASLWTRGSGVIAGLPAAYLHGVYRVPRHIPVELIATSRKVPDLTIIRDQKIADDEIHSLGPIRVTSPARTALDLARRLPRAAAVSYLDSLAAVTRLTPEEVWVLVERYRGTRGMEAARTAIDLMDGGSRSPEETALRLLLIDGNIPRPRTAIWIKDRWWSTMVAMGWVDAKVCVSWEPYKSWEGYRAVQVIADHELLQRTGWHHIRAHALHTSTSIRFRVRKALEQRRRR